MRKIDLEEAIQLRTAEKTVVVLGGQLIGRGNPQAPMYAAWTNGAGFSYMSRWFPPETEGGLCRQMWVSRALTPRGFLRLLNHLKRQAVAALGYGVQIQGSISVLMPSGKVATIHIDGGRVITDRTTKWWSTRIGKQLAA